LEINITKDWDNPLLDRKEITFNISHSGETPSRDEIKNKLVAQLNSRHELVIVDKIRTEYGTQNTYGYAKIYSDVDRANEIENKYVLKRNEPKPVEETEEEAVAEEPVEKAASEEPVEEAASEEPVEEAASEEPVEEAASEEPVEEAASEEPAEEVASEEPVEEEPVE